MESIAAPLVNKILGEYISNLNSNQLKIGLWDGNVKLENLSLKKDMFSQWKVPLDVVYGKIDHLNINIPWQDLKNKPLKIEIDNVYILINPIISADYDPVGEDLVEQERKQKRLREAEELITKGNQQSEGYFGQIYQTVVDNIQISIKNIHIRYEDSVSCPDTPFGIGFTLNELSVTSTDKDWKTDVINPPVNFGTIYKLLKLGYCGVYCTTTSTSFLKSTPGETYQCFKEAIAKSNQVDPARQYIMNPVSGVGKLIWVKVTDITRPKYELHLDFDDLAFNLDDKQYSTFMSIFGTLSRQSRSYPYRRFRPPKTISPKMDPKAWFKYAGKCILHDIHEKKYHWSWEYIKSRRDDRKRYILLYGRVRQGTFTDLDIDELNELELDLSYEDIRFYRHLTLKQITPKVDSPAKKTPTSTGWYGWITGAAQQAQEEDWNAKLRKLYESLEFDKNPAVDEVYPMDYVKIKVNSHLASGSLTLRDFVGDTVNDMAFMKFENLWVDYSQYPESFSSFFKMEHFVVSEPSTNNSCFSTLVEAKHEKANSNFLELGYESNPLDKRADNAVMIKMLPLKVIMNPVVLNKIVSFFQVDKDEADSMNRLQAVAQDAIEGVTAQTKAGLVFAIEEHKTLDLNIEVDAPIFVFPSNIENEEAPLLVLDAGHLKVASKVINEEKKLKVEELLNKSVDELMEDIYDKFRIDLTSVKFMLANFSSTKGFINEDYILENMDFSILFLSSILPRATEYSRFKLEAALPRLQLNVSEKKMYYIKKVSHLMTDTLLGRNTVSEVEDANDWAQSRQATNAELLEELENQTETQTVGSESSALLSQTLVDLKCIIGHASIVLSDDGSQVSKPVALFETKKIEFSGKMKQSEFSAIAKLGSLVVQDTSLEARPEFSKLMSPGTANQQGDGDALMVFEYQSVKSAQSESNVVKISLRPVKFIFVQESVLKIYKFLDSITASSDSPSKQTTSVASPVQQTSVNSFRSVTETVFSISSITILLVEDVYVVGSCLFKGFDIVMKNTPETMKMEGTVGKMFLYDGIHTNKRCVLLIDDDKAVDFVFQTFDKSERHDFDSSLKLNAASWRFLYDKHYIEKLSQYFAKFKEMQTLMDSAKQVAQESTLQIQQTAGKSYFKFEIQTPIVEVPNGTGLNCDRLVFYLGKICAESIVKDSEFGELELLRDRYNITLSSIKLESVFHTPKGNLKLTMIEDTNLSLQMDLLLPLPNMPQTITYANFTDVNIKITNHQYRLAVELLQLITADRPPTAEYPAPNPNTSSSYQEYQVMLPNISLEVFNCPNKSDIPKTFSLAKFIGHKVTAKMALRTNYPLLFELCFSSLSVLDTRSSNQSVFRDIMVPLSEIKNQFVLKYESSPKGTEYSVTIDHPKLILEIDHILAIQSFAVSAWYHEADKKVMPHPESVDVTQANPLKGKVSFLDAEIVVIAEPNNPNTDAVVLLSKHLVITQEMVITVSFRDVGMFFCVMSDRQQSELRFVDNCNVTFSLDDRIRPDGIYTYHASLETTKLLFRVSYQDILLLNELLNRLIRSTSSPNSSNAEEVTAVDPNPVTIRPNVSQRFRVSFEGIQAVLIDDLNNLHLPIFEFGLDKTLFEITNWSTKLQFDLGVSLYANYFNIKNSHWEPMIESWQFSINGRKEPESGKNSIVFLCRKKLEINVSHVLVETVLGLTKAIQSRPERSGAAVRREIRSPYVIKNLTGYPIVVWTDISDHPTELVKIDNGKSVNWRFDDWRTMRERTAPIPNRIAVQIEGPSWETLKGISVDREGVNAYPLRPAVDSILHSCVVDVQLKEKVKEVIIRSDKVIDNGTNVEIEIGLAVRGAKRPKQVVRIKPGDIFPIPIESAFHDLVYVRPADFGYNWSLQGFHWKDMIGKKKNLVYLINCPAFDAAVPNFNFQLNMDVLSLNHENPELVLRFMAPFVLENLLPFTFRYVIQDRVNRQQLSGSLAKGSKDFLHTIDPSHLLALSISIPDKDLRQKEGIIITSTDLEYRDENLVVRDSVGNELTLRVFYNDSKASGRTVSIFSPYIILNKTKQDMFFSAKSFMSSNRLTAGQGKKKHDGSTLDPILFSYSTFEPLRSRAHIKMRDSDWSRAISFEAVGSSYMTKLPAAGGLDNLLGIDIQEGYGKFYLSKVITINPRFILQNRMNEDLSFGQAGNMTPQLLKANSTYPLIKLKTDPDHDDYQLTVRLSNMLGSWSNPFSITEMGSIHLKLNRIGSLTEDLIRVDISIDKATIFVAFSREEGKWPYRIENNTPVDVTFYQLGSKQQYVVVPGEAKPYAWDYPSQENKNLVIEVNEKQRAIEVSQLGPLLPLKYTSGNIRGIMAMELVAEGPTIVLKLDPYDESKSIYKDTKPTIQDDFQVKEEESKVNTVIQARIEGIGISLISKDMKEILYASAKGLVIMHTDTTTDTMMNVTLKWFQVDNQLSSAVNPIFIYPTVLPLKGKEKEQEKPVFFGSFSHSKDTSHGVDYYQWLTVLLQELSVDLEEEFLKKLIDFTKFETTEVVEFSDAYDPSPEVKFPKSTEPSDRLYIENVLLHPIQINMSYTQSEKIRKNTEREHNGGTLSLVYDVLTMTVGNIHDAPIRLHALELVDVVISRNQFLDLIMTFYMRETYGQLHRFIGSADFLGNPAGLFKNVASGVKDMFYEPLQGFEITKPDEFGMGVAKGASSLMKKTVFGLSDTFSKFTGSIGKGLTVLTMDAKFQESRRLAGRNRPKHVGQGMASGAASFVRGITSGVTGIVSQPIEGAQESGVEGFFVGLGKGLLGVVAKPMIGVVDLATNVSEGIKNTTTVFEDELERQRLPRFIGKDGILRPYSVREALGQNWLKELEHGKYFQEIYICHLELRMDDLAAIVTERRLLMIHTRSLRLEYDAKFEDIRKVEVYDREIALFIKHSDQHQWVIPCPDPAVTEWLKKHVDDAFWNFVQNVRPYE